MFGFCAAASCMPFQEDWLNERSSTPPTSSTMHALSACPAVAPDDGLLAAAPPDVEPLLDDAGFEPHAARATDATATSPSTRTVPFTVPPQAPPMGGSPTCCSGTRRVGGCGGH